MMGYKTMDVTALTAYSFRSCLFSNELLKVSLSLVCRMILAMKSVTFRSCSQKSRCHFSEPRPVGWIYDRAARANRDAHEALA
jgi:hypothetical protein